MIRRMSARSFAERLTRYLPTLEAEVIAAEQKSIRDAQKTAVSLSSGGHSSASLADAGHPYARRRPQTASYPPAIINRQTGKFAEAWRMTPTIRRGQALETRLCNSSLVAVFMDGTAKMVARPIASAVLERIAERRAKRLQDAFKSAIRKVFET